MPNAAAIRWFKSQFHSQIEAAVQGTPFTVDLLTAVACQETGYIWDALRKKNMSTDQVLALCVGDTIDSSGGRVAFPKTKTALVAEPRGQEMFDLARQALVEMAQHIAGYKKAVENQNKFCHAFGIFQYDLQFFLDDPDYFLQRRYASFDASLAKAMEELQSKRTKIGLGSKSTLTELEQVAVAIAYNSGRYVPSKGLKQGHQSSDGKFYGEMIFDFLRLSKSVSFEGTAAGPGPGPTPLPPPTPVTATGSFFRVNVVETALNVRRTAEVPAANPKSNVIASLPDGHPVRAVTGKSTKGFLEIETSLNGAHIRGFVSPKFLEPATVTEIVVEAPAPLPPSSAVTAVYMPRKQPNSVTRRTSPATALSLNEKNQPGRSGETAEKRRAELAAIVEWLAVDNAAHKRYQPHSGLTFCNIYAHDFCHLAGCYLPRVWWTQGAIEALTQGKNVEPLLDKTIEEQRANALFRWLRDFGLRFGWRQTGTLTKLQTEVNQGAVGLIVARRKEEGPPGHIVAVVPETNERRARRNTAGEVLAPLQSQAGSKGTNFRYGTGKLDWWKDARFAEFAFWIHA
ncbi:MAG TPA: hypothetical protein VEK57_30900 [Thermoanaerobaculia bacterium]|nr:hypothetical protein [Thermoanaerobaculia bacterium]